MKILHIADTHLGYSAYRKITNDGINQREADIYQSFTKVIDYAIDHHVDLVLHAGDLFDSVRPNNRAITTALKQFLRLSDHGIPLVLIAGNHEQPKLQETGHIFQLFDHILHVHPVYNEIYEKKKLTVDDETVIIHCLPQINVLDQFQEQIDRIEKDECANYNLFLAHGSIQGIKEFSMNEFNEMMLPKQYLSSVFDYVALGHYHTYTEINDHAFYAGSIEPLSFAEANEKHGCIEILIQPQLIQPTFKTFQTRALMDTPSIECVGKSIEEIMDEIIKTIIKIEPDGKIFRINLKHILSHQYRGLDYRTIRQYCQGALHYEIQAQIEEQERSYLESHGKIDSIVNEFKQFVDQQNINEKQEIIQKGLEYIQETEQKKEDV